MARRLVDLAIAASPLAEIRVPAHLDLDRTLPLSAVWTGGGQVLVAGRDDASGMPVLAVLRAGQGRRIWEGESGRTVLGEIDPEQPAADLAALPGGQALALVTNGPFLATDVHARKMRRVPLPRPDRLFRDPDGPGAIATLLSRTGRLTLATVTEDARPELTGWDLRATQRRRGPALPQGARPSLVSRDAAGRTLLGIDDPGNGFALWRESGPGDWARIATPGAARWGMNASLFAQARWEGGLAISAGMGPEIRRDLHGLRIAGEILDLVEDEVPDLAILAGEVRTGPRALLVPRLGPLDPLMQAWQGGRGDALALAHWDGALVVFWWDRVYAEARLFRVDILDPEGPRSSPLVTTGEVAGLTQGPQGPVALIWAA